MSLCIGIVIKYITWSLAGQSGSHCCHLLVCVLCFGICSVLTSNILVHTLAEISDVYSLRDPGPRLPGLSEPTVLQLWSALARTRTL